MSAAMPRKKQEPYTPTSADFAMVERCLDSASAEYGISRTSYAVFAGEGKKLRRFVATALATVVGEYKASVIMGWNRYSVASRLQIYREEEPEMHAAAVELGRKIAAETGRDDNFEAKLQRWKARQAAGYRTNRRVCSGRHPFQKMAQVAAEEASARVRP